MKMCPVEWSGALAKWKEHILMPRGECSVSSDEILDPTHGQKQEPKLEKELAAVKGPRWKLMMKLVMQAEPSTRHETRSRWSGNARRTTAHTFTPSQLPVFTDFAAQQECRGQDRATCGTSAHANKCIFVVLSNPREVTVKENGTRRQKRIHDCDVWTFFLPASGKYKENDYLAHHVCLNYIVSFYQNKMKKKGVDLTHVLLFTEGCPGQYACRQNYQAIARFPAGPGNDSSPVKCSIKGIQLTHVIAETGDFKGVWDGGGKDSTHFIHRLERQGEIRDVSSGEMVPFSARTPFKVFDSCRSLMEAITPKPPEKKQIFSFDQRIFRYATHMPENDETCAANEGKFKRDDPDVILFNREIDNWDSSDINGSKAFKVFTNGMQHGRGPVDPMDLRSRSLQCPCVSCRTWSCDTSKCEYRHWLGDFEKHPIVLKAAPSKTGGRQSKRLTQHALNDKAEAMKQTAALIKVDHIYPFGNGLKGDHDPFWLARVLAAPKQAEITFRTAKGEHGITVSKGTWFVSVQWLERCTKSGESIDRQYVDGGTDKVLLEALIVIDEKLCLVPKTISVERSSGRGANKRQRTEEFECLLLATDSYQRIMSANFEKYTIQR